MKIILIIALGLALAGCASVEERYLTKEQDEAMHEACQYEDGCVVLRGWFWQQIREQLFPAGERI